MGSPETLSTYRNKEILKRTRFIGWPRYVDIKKGWYGNNGFQIGAKPETPDADKRRVVPSDTALHEATHTVPALVNGTPVEEVSIVPGPGYLGITKLGRPDPIAALAPHSTGHNGTGHDVFIASLMVNDIGPASNVAKSIAQSRQKEIAAVASLLEEKGTITGYEAKEAMDSVDRKKEENKATVFIKSPDGSEKRIPDVNVDNGVVIVPQEWVKYKLPKEDTIFSRN